MWYECDIYRWKCCCSISITEYVVHQRKQLHAVPHIQTFINHLSHILFSFSEEKNVSSVCFGADCTRNESVRQRKNKKSDLYFLMCSTWHWYIKPNILYAYVHAAHNRAFVQIRNNRECEPQQTKNEKYSLRYKLLHLNWMRLHYSKWALNITIIASRAFELSQQSQRRGILTHSFNGLSIVSRLRKLYCNRLILCLSRTIIWAKSNPKTLTHLGFYCRHIIK